jgi:hypothetical protein
MSSRVGFALRAQRRAAGRELHVGRNHLLVLVEIADRAVELVGARACAGCRGLRGLALLAASAA